MDEILIGDKTYISSKQAAKLTGYAKDYIGQLCREGRVTARLVGRSWYVLESAIQDHRFGSPSEADPVEEPVIVPDAKEDSTDENKLQRTWESPKYEAEIGNELPSVNLLAEEAENADKDNSVGLQDTWQAWFSRISQPADAEKANNETSMVENDASDTVEEIQDKPSDETEQVMIAENESEDTLVPIRTIYNLPPQSVMPKVESTEALEDIKITENVKIMRKKSVPLKKIAFTLELIGLVIALTLITLATTNSGYLDKYIISTKPGQLISGVTLYNK